MAKKLEITILTDRTSWMNKYNAELARGLEKTGHSVRLIHSKDELQRGDIAFFLSCFEIVGKKYLELNTSNIVVHASALPQGKGWSPMSWQILEGKNEIPVTLFEACEEVDAGDIYLQDTVKLDGTELIDRWQEKLGEKICEMSRLFVLKTASLSLKNAPPPPKCTSCNGLHARPQTNRREYILPPAYAKRQRTRPEQNYCGAVQSAAHS